MKKRAGHTVSEAVVMLILLIVGGGLIYGSQFNKAVGQQMVSLLEKPFFATTLGAVLICAVILNFLSRLRPRREVYIDYSSEGGTVSIGMNAVQDFIERVGHEFTAITRVQARLVQQKETLDLVVGISIREGNKIPELTHVLQQRIRESVRESLGLDELGSITVQVKEIVGDTKKTTESKTESMVNQD